MQKRLQTGIVTSRRNNRFVKILRICLIAVFFLFIPSCDYRSGDSEADPQIEDAIQWAEEHLGSEDYEDLCLMFVQDSYEYGAKADITRYSYARLAADSTGALSNFGSTIPRGAFVYFNSEKEIDGVCRNWGHVGLALGPDEIIHASPEGSVRIDKITDVDREYIGWAWPDVDPPITN